MVPKTMQDVSIVDAFSVIFIAHKISKFAVQLKKISFKPAIQQSEVNNLFFLHNNQQLLRIAGLEKSAIRSSGRSNFSFLLAQWARAQASCLQLNKQNLSCLSEEHAGIKVFFRALNRIAVKTGQVFLPISK